MAARARRRADVCTRGLARQVRGVDQELALARVLLHRTLAADRDSSAPDHIAAVDRLLERIESLERTRALLQLLEAARARLRGLPA